MQKMSLKILFLVKTLVLRVIWEVNIAFQKRYAIIVKGKMNFL